MNIILAVITNSLFIKVIISQASSLRVIRRISVERMNTKRLLHSGFRKERRLIITVGKFID